MEIRDDLISRAAACNAISKMIHEYRENGEDATADGMILAMRYGIKRLPAVDAAPVVHARWIDECCSKCGTYVYHGYADNYCPHCGAKIMEVEHGNRNHP